jgi:hypothetical protein
MARREWPRKSAKGAKTSGKEVQWFRQLQLVTCNLQLAATWQAANKFDYCGTKTGDVVF